MKRLLLTLAILLTASFVFSFNADAALLFSDDFNSGARTEWGNEVGDWYAHDGVYDTHAPSNNPLTYSSVTSLPNLMDFTLELDINRVHDGGIWLRSPGTDRGILLVTHGISNSFYWHIVDGTNDWTTYGPQGYSGLYGKDIKLKITVTGDIYEAFVDEITTPLTTLNTNKFSSGRVALYDFGGGVNYETIQTFDNVKIYGEPVVPEPATMVLFGIGSTAMAFARRRKKLA